MLSIGYEIAKKILKTMRKKKNKHNKIVLLARSKLNSRENIIYRGLIDNEITNEELTTITNEERNWKKVLEVM